MDSEMDLNKILLSELPMTYRFYIMHTLAQHLVRQKKDYHNIKPNLEIH